MGNINYDFIHKEEGGVKNKDDICGIYDAGADFVVGGSMIESKAANL